MISTVAINNHSVTLSQTGASLSSSSVVLNRVYWFRRGHLSPDPRPHKKSTKILGFGIFMIGIVILSISLIIGIEFPLYVSRKILKDQCIQEKKHVLYDNWVRDTDYRRINRVYFWAMVNQDDFIKGLSAPKFIERGPYVYTETRRRLNVIFSNKRLSYQTWVSQTYNAQLTQSECGNTCRETDNVSVLNTVLLRKLYHFGGWDNYIRAQLTRLMNVIIGEVIDNQSEEDVYKYLGCISDSCSNLTANSTFSNETYVTIESLSFGQFVRNHAGTDILNSSQFIKQSGYFNTILIKTMYMQIANTVSNQTFSEETKQVCLKQNVEENSHSYWSVYVKNISGLTNEYTAFYSGTSGNETVYFSRACGFSSAVLTLITYLRKFLSWTSVVWTLNACDLQNGAETCEEITDSFETVLEFLNLTLEFSDAILLSYVTEVYKLKPENNIVFTKNQRELVVGYDRLIETSDSYDVQSIDGILEHHRDFVDAYHRSPVKTVSTCLDGETTDNNMVIREFDGKALSPEGVHETIQPPISGRTSCFPPSQTCRACVTSTPNTHEYDVFTEGLQRNLKYRSNKETDIQGVHLYEFTVIDDDLRETTSCGLINVTLILNYPSLVGNPYYMQSGCGYLQKHTQDYARDALSFIKEEPLTGRFWEQSTRLQTSAVIMPEYVGGVVKPSFKDILNVGQPLPLYWVDRRLVIVQSEIDAFESKIHHLMRVSCGGLIGLTIVSFIIMVLSIFVGLMSNRKNKVQPVEEDNLPSVPE